MTLQQHVRSGRMHCGVHFTEKMKSRHELEREDICMNSLPASTFFLHTSIKLWHTSRHHQKQFCPAKPYSLIFPSSLTMLKPYLHEPVSRLNTCSLSSWVRVHGPDKLPMLFLITVQVEAIAVIPLYQAAQTRKELHCRLWWRLNLQLETEERQRRRWSVQEVKYSVCFCVPGIHPFLFD